MTCWRNHWWFDWKPFEWLEILNQHRSLLAVGLEVFNDALIVNLVIVQVRITWRYLWMK